jgi:hypothetical protein
MVLRLDGEADGKHSLIETERGGLGKDPPVDSRKVNAFIFHGRLNIRRMERGG